MKHKKISYFLLLTSYLYPIVSFAALGGVRNLLCDFGGLLNIVIRVIFGIALVYFFWGVGQFILNDAGNEKTREEGKKKIIWGVVALFVFVSIYGLLAFIGELIDIPASTGTSSSSCRTTTNTYPTPPFYQTPPGPLKT